MSKEKSGINQREIRAFIESRYEIKKSDDFRAFPPGYYLIFIGDFCDGQLYTTKQRAAAQRKIYESLECFTGEIRTYRGEWWHGVPRYKRRTWFNRAVLVRSAAATEIA